MIWITVDKESNIPLIRQIYNQIKILILEGKLKEGECLPSTRWLASNLEVSRNVIMEVYDQLLAEGYVESRQGSGTRVAKGTLWERKQQKIPESRVVQPVDKVQDYLIDLRSGVPELNLFPKGEWGQLLKRVCNEVSPQDLSYSQPEGRTELRQALAEYLFRVRGISCRAEQILITSGATQGLALAGRLLYSPGAEAIVEDPVNRELLKVICAPGYAINPITVDERGIMTELIRPGEKVGLIYVTPSHQFPMGGVLPIQRRIELIKLALKTDCFIIEDDYDSEYRYEGQPISALYELDPDRVIYIGSFSKILAPALRLGYMVLPDRLLKAYRSLKKYSDVHTASVEQLAMAHFINERKLERHVAKMKKVYSQRRQAVIKGLNEYFPGRYNVGGQASGLHLIVEFPGVELTQQVVDKAKEAGVVIYPVEQHAIQKAKHTNKMIIGYGHLTETQIAESLKRLKDALF